MRRARLSVNFDEHQKYYDYGAEEMGVIACAVAFSSRHLSDGRLPRAWPARRFGDEVRSVVDRLLDDGVWRRLPSGDYEIVDFLDHNRSKSEFESVALLKRTAGSAGGKARAAGHGASKNIPARPVVYFVQSGDKHGPIKIGYADNGRSRVSALQTGNPDTLKVLAFIESTSPSMETELHARFAGLRLRGEWFRPEPELLDYIASLPEAR